MHTGTLIADLMAAVERVERVERRVVEISAAEAVEPWPVVFLRNLESRNLESQNLESQNLESQNLESQNLELQNPGLQNLGQHWERIFAGAA